MNTEQRDLAHACALDVLDDRERNAVAALRNAPDPAVRAEFEAAVRHARETLATVALLTAAPPPPQLLENILARILDEQLDAGSEAVVVLPTISARRPRSVGWRWAVGAAAAVAVFAGGAVIGNQLRDTSSISDAQRVLAAEDLRTTRVELPGAGAATALYSKESDAGVVMLVDAPAPAPGTVYQMWLIGASPQPVSAGLLTDVTATTTVVVNGIHGAPTLAFTVEPVGGSPQPTTAPFAVLDLT